MFDTKEMNYHIKITEGGGIEQILDSISASDVTTTGVKEGIVAILTLHGLPTKTVSLIMDKVVK